jgi:hypothetical protein
MACPALRKVASSAENLPSSQGPAETPESRIVASTQELILGLFAPGDGENKSLLQLASHVDALTSAATLTPRLDAFVDLYNWTREPDGTIVDPLPSFLPSASSRGRCRGFLTLIPGRVRAGRAYVRLGNGTLASAHRQLFITVVAK